MAASTETRSGPRPLAAGGPIPKLSWKAARGRAIDTRAGGWRLLVVYRGKHCGMCRQYLIELNGMREDFAKLGIAVMALSADDARSARAWVRELGLQYPLGHGLTPAQMKKLGLYVSPADDEVDHAFAEPAVFALRDEGIIHFACVGNAPYGRPPLHAVFEGLKTAIEDELQPHGTSWPAPRARR